MEHTERIQSPRLKAIIDANLCVGCGLCAAVSRGAITMAQSADHYLRPVQAAAIDETTDRLIADVCPGYRLTQPLRPEAVDHPLWGPIVAARTGYATDPQVRHRGASGGVLTALLTHLLESGAVDRVVQITASTSRPLENRTTTNHHAADIMLAAGSRYAPSAPLEHIIDELDQPGRFAVVGKPCDIAALRAYAQHDERVNEKVAVMLSFFCAGVPSFAGGQALAAAMRAPLDHIARFTFRGNGWPGRATATLRDGSEKSTSYADSWGQILSRHLQFRCKICPDGSGGAADIVCADAWESDDNGYPMFEEQDGRSLVVTRTAHGESVLSAALASGAVAAAPVDIGSIAGMQPAQASRKKLVLSRLLALAALGRRIPKYLGFQLWRATKSAGIAANLRSALGMVRRTLDAGRP